MSRNLTTYGCMPGGARMVLRAMIIITLSTLAIFGCAAHAQHPGSSAAKAASGQITGEPVPRKLQMPLCGVPRNAAPGAGGCWTEGSRGGRLIRVI